jgi:hypothetical protein
MFGYFKRRNFRSHVRTDMSYLMGFGLNDDVLHGLLRAYPGIWRAVDSDFSQGKSTMNSAVGVLAIVFTNEIEHKIPASHHLQMEHYIINGKGEPKFVIERGIKTFLAQVIAQKDLGKVSDELYKYTISEIIGVLRGLPENERITGRIVAPLLKSSANML